jgi:hypothetical protein
MFVALFTPQTGVPAFQREGGILTVRRRRRDDEDTLDVDGWRDGGIRAGRYGTEHVRGADARLDGCS